MKIHFVCTGNFYRSRLAEAYINSKEIPDIEASSSGVESDYYFDENAPIAWYTMRLIYNSNLVPFLKKMPTQTTSELLASQDKVIFMTQYHYDFAKTHFAYIGKNYEVWNIMDVDDFEEYPTFNDMDKIAISEKTFQQIKEKVDALIAAIVVGR